MDGEQAKARRSSQQREQQLDESINELSNQQENQEIQPKTPVQDGVTTDEKPKPKKAVKIKVEPPEEDEDEATTVLEIDPVEAKEALASDALMGAEKRVLRKVSLQVPGKKSFADGARRKKTETFLMDVRTRKYQELFIELDELYMPSQLEGCLEWRQVSRWIRYEESLEEGSGKWGKAHVPTLSFGSLLQLKQHLQTGTVMLDININSWSEMVEMLVREFVAGQQIREEDSTRLRESLRLRHRQIKTEKQKVRFGGCLTNCWEKRKKDDEDELMKRIGDVAEAAEIMVGSVSFLDQPVVGFVRLYDSVKLPHVVRIGLPVRFIFVLMGPLNVALDYLEMGRVMGSLLSNTTFQESVYSARSRSGILRAINEYLDESIVIPPLGLEHPTLIPFEQLKHTKNQIERRRSVRPWNAEEQAKDLEEFLQEEAEKHEEDPLRRTGKLFGGLRREFYHRFPQYLSDIRDALSMKCVTSVIFIFLTCFFPALTFGAILDNDFAGEIGIKETLLATSVFGALFSLTSTQPMLLIGVSGPMLIFEKSVYSFCISYHLDFLQVRIWLAVWGLIFCLLIVAWEGTFLVKYITRFSDDILTVLVSVIFISECIHFLEHMFHLHPVMVLQHYCEHHDNASLPMQIHGNYSYNDSHSLINESHHDADSHHDGGHGVHEYFGLPANQPNTALLSCILVMGTCFLAIVFRNFRNSKYFGRQIRTALGDFGPSLAILIMVLIDLTLFHDKTISNRLSIQPGLTPTIHRPWFIAPWPVPGWIPIGAAFAGLLLVMILFCENEVVEMLLAEEHVTHLKKGTGYHWDLVLCGVFLVLCSLVGFPWLVAAPVRTVAHVNSLTKYKLRAPGLKPKVIGVVEQRVTGFVLHIFIGLTLLLTDLLRMIPLAIMFGIFLYLGFMNMIGVPMLSRFILFFVPVKYHPATTYCLRVSTWRMHLYSVIQLGCCFFVGVIKSMKTTAFSYPLFILIAIVIRQVALPKIFTDFELYALDGEEEEEEEEVDFYKHMSNWD